MTHSVNGLATVVEIGPAGRVIPTDPEALLYQSEVAHLIGISGRTLEAWRVSGKEELVFVSISRRAVRYRRRDVLSWIETRLRRSTSDTGAGGA